MRPLSAQHIIQVWEQGHGQHDIDRALTMLAAACPGHSRVELAALTVGQRDSQLLTLREMTFGKRLNCFSTCPHCEDRLQFSLSTESLRVAHAEKGPRDLSFNLEGITLRLRLPDSRDLAAVANCSERDDPHLVLLRRCILEGFRSGAAIDPEDLPETVVSAIADKIGTNDPQAEVLLVLNCSGCSHRWTSAFDVVSFFWKEITAHAKRLLEEVVVLSRTYGWREMDILGLSPVRKRFYLERAT